MIDIDRPTIDWLAMAKSMGVPAVAVETAEDFTTAMIRSSRRAGPATDRGEDCRTGKL